MSCNCNNARTSFGKSLSGFGGYLGDKVYDYGAKKFKTWTGYGDYTIHSNSLINKAGNGDPILETRGRTIRVSYREYLGEVTTGSTPGTFNATSYTINPANVVTFPWLSTIAQQYDQYKPLGIIFEFKSTASDNTSSTALGSVIMATEYDILDRAYTSKQEMLNAAYSNEMKASENQLHGIECDPNELQRNVFYTRRLGASSTATNSRDYDMGVFTIAVQGGGLTAYQSIGSLYVHYEFELLKEQIFGGLQARDRLWTIYRNLTPVAGTRNWSTYYGLTEESAVTHMQAGLNLGIKFGLDAIYFPRRWAGATFRIRCIYVSIGNFTVGTSTAGINVQCSVVSQPTKVALGNSPASSGGWQNVVTSQTATEWMCAAETIVRLDDVVTENNAQFTSTYIGWMNNT